LKVMDSPAARKNNTIVVLRQFGSHIEIRRD